MFLYGTWWHIDVPHCERRQTLPQRWLAAVAKHAPLKNIKTYPYCFFVVWTFSVYTFLFDYKQYLVNCSVIYFVIFENIIDWACVKLPGQHSLCIILILLRWKFTFTLTRGLNLILQFSRFQEWNRIRFQRTSIYKQI